MRFEGIVITGYSGAGKDTVVRHLCQDHPEFARVPAVTTREQRADDSPGTYRYLDRSSFEELVEHDKLLVSSSYREHHYGITRAALDQIVQQHQTPVLILTPAAALRFTSENPGFLSIFLIAAEQEVDRRLEGRGTDAAGRRLAAKQRGSEETSSYGCHYRVQNDEVTDVVAFVLELWEYRDRSGILPKRLIERMTKCQVLLEGADTDQIAGASYDLRLGDEYFYGGRIYRLSEHDPILLIEPYDTAIVTSHERASLPLDMTARFDLSVGMFTQGIILSNGPQVDPGFRGPLFCVLLNTSSSPVLLKRRQHYATIEFHKIIAPTSKYKGRYQGQSLVAYLPHNAAQGAINRLHEEIRALRRGTEHFQGITLAFLSVVLAVIALIFAVFLQ